MELLIIFGVGIIISLISILIQKKFVDNEVVKSLKHEIKKLQEEMRKHKNDAAKVNELLKKTLELQRDMMKYTIKPTIISSIIILIAFIPLTYFFGGFLFGDFKLYFTLPFCFPIIGKQIAWIWVFIFVSLVSSLIFKKLFDLGY